MSDDVLVVLSLGAGVQSSCMALMADCGELLNGVKPDCAIFADVGGDEPGSVYSWLSFLEDTITSFPIYRVCNDKGGLSERLSKLRVSGKTGNTYLKPMIPAFADDGGKAKIMLRQCTADHKIMPIRKKSRLIMKESGKRKAEMWLGITTDEASRMKDSQVKFVKHRWPLIEMGMSRDDCLDWMGYKGYPKPPRSACVYCPFHSNKEWLRLKTEEPEDFERAIIMDEKIRNLSIESTAMRSVLYLHRSLKPLREIDFDEKDAGGFNNECEGMCGV